jgi:hypothetical protein
LTSLLLPVSLIFSIGAFSPSLPHSDSISPTVHLPSLLHIFFLSVSSLKQVSWSLISYFKKVLPSKARPHSGSWFSQINLIFRADFYSVETVKLEQVRL